MGLAHVALAILILLAPAAPTHAQSPAELIMVEDPGCPYCARWMAEVAPGYAMSPEGAFAPLRRVGRSDPRVAGFQRVVYSPTFIVVRDGVEVGRIIGYGGADSFWPQVSQLLAKAGFKEQRPAAAKS